MPAADGGIMGRFIVIEVDDDKLADALVQRLSKDIAKYRVVGFFARPKSHCACPLEMGGYDSRRQVVRGAKWGWWVHNIAGCKRPRRGSHALANLITRDKYPVSPGSEYTQKVDTLHVYDVLSDRLGD